MKNIFNINKKKKPLIKIPGYTFIDYHNLQPGISYYIRKIDKHNNFDFVEAKLTYTGNKIKNRLTFGAGTNIKILDSFMYTFLKHKDENFENYHDFIDLTLKESNLYNDFEKAKYTDGSLPKEFKTMREYKQIIDSNYKILYVTKSKNLKGSKAVFEQIYVVFVKEVKQQLIDTDINYIIFKPVSVMTRMEYIKKGSGLKYNVFEYPEICIPTSLLK